MVLSRKFKPGTCLHSTCSDQGQGVFFDITLSLSLSLRQDQLRELQLERYLDAHAAYPGIQNGVVA